MRNAPDGQLLLAPDSLQRVGKQGRARAGGPRSDKARRVVAFFSVALVVLVVGGIGTLLYVSDYLPRAMARELLGLLAADRIAEASAKIDPTVRATYPEAKLREWGAAAKGFDDIDWGRKSSMGTTRGGRTVASTSGYLRYPNTKAERPFRISIIRDDGIWWVSSFSVDALAVPR